MPATRRLAAILAADVAGYSRLMGEDEAGTAQALREHRAVAEPLVAKHGGRIVKTTGDGVLIEFASIVGAVECAIALQQLASERNAGIADERRMEWRIGVHLGDVLVEGDDILGDGVNIAARLEGIAEPGGICISEDAFRQVRGKVAAEFVDIGEQSLKNIARPLRVYRIGPSLAPEPPAGLPLPDKPSIAVLPFANMSGDPEQEYFADGMVEEIITALSRIRWLFVIARNSSFTYKGHAFDVKQVGRELGVRYVLEGSVRKAGANVRITAQLIDAQSGTHLWADRFDGSMEDVFDLQDRVAVSVAGVIEPALQAAEMRRSAARPTTDVTAYDLYLRALSTFYPITKERVFAALGLLEQAIAIDPNYGPALSWAAICHMRLVNDGWTEAPETNRDKATDLARQALQMAQNDPGTLANAAEALAYFGEDIGAMIGLVDRALALNPSFARGWYRSGVLRVWAGQADLAIEHVETSLRLSPRERMGQPLTVMGIAYFLKRRFDEAASKLLLSIQHDPGFPNSYRTLAACYARMGRLDEARAIVARLRTITPQVVPSDLPWRNPEHRELYLSGLRLAAGETV
jgi:TolB-like protein/class 3 adenylate cyclase/tetratricopeptide (TPR) repeat protein